MGNLQAAFDAVIQACESPLISYNMYNYMYPATYDQKPDRTTINSYYDFSANNWTRAACCDCSSLMGWALFRGGYTDAFTACTTDTMFSLLPRCGWTDLGSPNSVNWQPGDILLGPTHTEMVYWGNGSTTGRTMGAHGRGGYFSPESNPSHRQELLNAQVSIYSGLNTYQNFTHIYRDLTGIATVAAWHQNQNNAYLGPNNGYDPNFPSQEQLENMMMITSYMHTHTSATDACIAGIIGNMVRESTLNPNLWQNGIGVTSGGYGLVQWTPATKYLNSSYCPSDYATNATANGEGQMECLVYGIEHTWDQPGGEWAPSYDGYSYTYQQFYALTDPEEACKAFLHQYERAGVAALNDRLTAAVWVFNHMTTWGEIGVNHPTDRFTNKMLLMMSKRRKGHAR